MPMSARSRRPVSVLVSMQESRSRFLAVEHRRAAFGYNMLGPAHRVRRVHVYDLAYNKRVKEHPYRGQMLLYRGFAKPSRRLSI